MSPQEPKPPSVPTQQAAVTATPALLSTEERVKLHARLREQMSISRLKVMPPAGWTPYWARKNDEGELGRLDYREFRIVKEIMDGGKTPYRYKAQGLKADGTYTLGDVILMEIRTEIYDFYMTENTEKADAMAQSAKDKFVEDASKQGSPTFTVARGK